MKWLKFGSALTMGAFMLGAVWGCGSSGQSKPLIAFVTNNASQYWTFAKAGVDKASKELPDYDVQFVMPGQGTAEEQKQDVEDLLAKGVKAIAISPNDPKNETDWLNDVASKTILLTQDSDAPASNRVCYIGTDNHAAGVKVGDLIKQALGPAGGKIMLFVGSSDAQNAIDRMQGIRDSIKGTKISIIDVRTDDTDHARAKANAADALTKYPDLAAEVGIWSYNGPAIVSAVEEAHKIGKVKIICFDNEDGTLAGIKSGAVYATVVQHPEIFGYQATKMMAQLVKGDKSSVPASKQIFIDTLIVNKDNIDSYEASQKKLLGPS